MGNAQAATVCFKAPWTKFTNLNSQSTPKNLWDIEVRVVDLNLFHLGDFMRKKKVCIIANVTSQ